MQGVNRKPATLLVLQDRSQRVALLTDGRMSCASGSILAAMHVVPEALDGGMISKLRESDPLLLDAELGVFQIELDAAEVSARDVTGLDLRGNQSGCGRELFGQMRAVVGGAEQGASSFLLGPVSAIQVAALQPLVGQARREERSLVNRNERRATQVGTQGAQPEGTGTVRRRAVPNPGCTGRNGCGKIAHSEKRPDRSSGDRCRRLER